MIRIEYIQTGASVYLSVIYTEFPECLEAQFWYVLNLSKVI